MAAARPFAGAAYVKVEVDFTSDWNNATAYTDVTADLRFGSGLSWERGRNDEYQTTSPGNCEFTLNNRARTYDPTTNANMVINRPGRVTCYYPTTATAYQQIDFLVDSWTPAWTVERDAIVQSTATERWAALGWAQGGLIGAPNQTSVQRLNAVADSGDWPSGLRAFTAGTWPMGAETIQSQSRLALMQGIADSQNQTLYQRRDGYLVTNHAFNAVGTNIGTFGDGGGTELPFTAVAYGVDGSYLYTVVQLTVGGDAWQQGSSNIVTAIVGSPYTTTKYGWKAFTRSVGALTRTDAQSLAGQVANYIGNQDAYRIKSVVINPLANPADIFPVVLTADLGNPVTVVFQPIGGGARISETGKIRSIRHEINSSGWTVTWGLSP